ncbi:MAG: DUF4126 domain-containing protein [Verrucomicrobiota bacterium]
MDHTQTMNVLLAVMAGLGLSAAAGFRVFVPLFVLAIAAKSDMVQLSESFLWLDSWPTLIILGTATAVEIAAYYVPWVDNLLDTIASPAAIIAGTLISASVLPEMDPGLHWTLAVIMGGAPAGIVQGTTVLTRGTSTATTAGVGNPIVSTAEVGGSLLLSILAIVVPILVGILVLALLYFCISRLIRALRRRRNRQNGALA